MSTEISLHVLAYNLKRVMRILGTDEMMRVLTSKAAHAAICALHRGKVRFQRLNAARKIA